VNRQNTERGRRSQRVEKLKQVPTTESASEEAELVVAEQKRRGAGRQKRELATLVPRTKKLHSYLLDSVDVDKGPKPKKARVPGKVRENPKRAAKAASAKDSDSPPAENAHIRIRSLFRKEVLHVLNSSPFDANKFIRGISHVDAENCDDALHVSDYAADIFQRHYRAEVSWLSSRLGQLMTRTHFRVLLLHVEQVCYHPLHAETIELVGNHADALD
jgi:hypothetical protein